MYGLDCIYYNNTFNTIGELLDDIKVRGMDPNYEITRDGTLLGITAWELISD